MEELILPSQRRAFYCGLTVKVLLLVTMETVNLSKSIPRNYGAFLPMIRRIG